MAAGTYNMLCEQGATLRRKFTWTDANDRPINLTGCTARMQVRPTYRSPTRWLTVSSTAQDVDASLVLGGAAGTITLFVSDAKTASFPASRGVYDLEIVMANGDVVRFLQGQFQVTAEVTK